MAVCPILTEGDLLYCAGLFDGEGSAGVYDHKGKYNYLRKDGTTIKVKGKQPILSVVMSDSDPIWFLSLCFGGNVTKYTPKQKVGAKSQYKLVHRWGASSRKALEVAKVLYQYVKNNSKAEQLNTIVSYYGLFDQKRSTKLATKFTGVHGSYDKSIKESDSEHPQDKKKFGGMTNKVIENSGTKAKYSNKVQKPVDSGEGDGSQKNEGGSKTDGM